MNLFISNILPIFHFKQVMPLFPSVGFLITPAQLRLRRSPPGNTLGFTLIEVLVVVMIIVILSAIAAPSWLGFVNRQRVNKTSDTVLSALQTAQREAKRTRKNYSISFQVNNSTPQFAVYPGLPPADFANISGWQSLGAELSIKPGQISFFSTSNSFTFDDQGLVSQNPTQTIPFYMTISVPGSNVRQCVIVQTILGVIKTDSGNYNSTTDKGCKTS